MFNGIAEGIKSLTSINTGLSTLSNKLETIIKKLEKIDSLSSDVAGNINKVTNNGGQIGVGTSGKSQMPNSLAPVAPANTMPNQHQMPGTTESRARFFMRNGGMQMVSGGLQAAAGIGGAMFSAVPGMDVVGANALGYYQASLGMGVNPTRVQQQTFKDLAGGFSSVGSGAASAAILRNRYMMPGTADFRQTMREVRGAYGYMGMSNETAAAALGGFKTGKMGANLYQYGINVFDPTTGKARSTGQITKDLFNRMFRDGANVKEVQQSLQYGFAGANLRNMGFDEAQQQIISQGFLDIAAGKNPDLATKKPGSKLLEAQGRINTSESKLIMDKQDALIEGYSKGATLVEEANKIIGKMPDAFFELKGATDAVIGSNVGQGMVGLGIAIQGLIGVILGASTMLMANAGMGALGKGVGGAGGMAGMLGKAGKGLMKGGGILGGLMLAGNSFMTAKGAAERGEGFDWGNLLESTAGGALAGFMTAGPWGALAGALAGGGAYAVGSAMGDDNKGGKGGPDTATDASVPTLPVGNVRVSSNYGMRQVKALGHTKPTMHRGTDYAVPTGTPVKAVNNGTVIRVENTTRGYEGWHVLVDHGDGWSTLYAHMSQVNVRVGQQVRKGEVLGLSGTAGTGPHLHFEVRRNGVATDPSQYMSGAIASGTKAVTDDKNSGVVGSALGSSASMVSLDISGVKGNQVKLSEMYGKQSATEMLSGNAIQMGSEFADVSGENSPASSFGSGPLNQPELLKTLFNAGFKTPSDLAEAYAIAMAESNGRPGAYNGDRSTGDDSYGIFQINMIDELGQERLKKFAHMGLKKKEDLFDPKLNARIAAWMSQKGNNWSAWSSYGGSRYRDNLPSEDSLIQTMSEMGMQFSSGVGGGTGTDGMVPTMSRSGSSSGTTVNHAGNTVTINVQVMQATESEAINLARKVKEILEHDKSITAIGGQ